MYSVKCCMYIKLAKILSVADTENIYGSWGSRCSPDLLVGLKHLAHSVLVLDFSDQIMVILSSGTLFCDAKTSPLQLQIWLWPDLSF